jgi:hypothetical protein
LGEFEKIYICIDALDECNDSSRRQLLQSMVNLYSQFPHAVRLFLTGRPFMKEVVQRHLPISPCAITLVANEEDIRKFVGSQLEWMITTRTWMNPSRRRLLAE